MYDVSFYRHITDPKRNWRADTHTLICLSEVGVGITFRTTVLTYTTDALATVTNMKHSDEGHQPGDAHVAA